jgi:hypothetical protein
MAVLPSGFDPRGLLFATLAPGPVEPVRKPRAAPARSIEQFVSRRLCPPRSARNPPVDQQNIWANDLRLDLTIREWRHEQCRFIVFFPTRSILFLLSVQDNARLRKGFRVWSWGGLEDKIQRIWLSGCLPNTSRCLYVKNFAYYPQNHQIRYWTEKGRFWHSGNADNDFYMDKCANYFLFAVILVGFVHGSSSIIFCPFSLPRGNATWWEGVEIPRWKEWVVWN